MYARCVADGGCTEPRSRESYTRDSYYGNPDYDEYPVISVTWHQAEAYCQWAGRELPTEAQWEKAARGTDGRTYPWGNEPPAGNLVNFADKNTDYDWSNKAIDDGYEDSAPVGTYPDGASTYSALDMAGNVLEWVADWYGDYPSGSVSNPTGPTIGESRVLRGGSFSYNGYYIRSAVRERVYPVNTYSNVGFRCLLSP
jgi:formylglycine-generating enzyme required for sulfatase activity